MTETLIVTLIIESDEVGEMMTQDQNEPGKMIFSFFFFSFLKTR